MSPEGRIKLADFGHAIDTREERPVTRLGTLDYMVSASGWYARLKSFIKVCVAAHVDCTVLRPTLHCVAAHVALSTYCQDQMPL